MKYIDEFDIDLVNQALSFNSTDMHIQGTCDLFTTKPVGSDRKLYKVLGKLYNSEEDGNSNETGLESRSNSNSNNDNNNNNNIQQVFKQNRQNSNISINSNNSNKSVDSLNSHFIQLKKRSLSYSYTKPIISFNEEDKKMKRAHSFTSPSPEPEIVNSNFNSPFGPLNQSSSRKLFGYLIGALNATFPDHDFSTVQPNHFTLLQSSNDLISKVNSILISAGKSTGLDWIWQTINTHIDLDQCICFQFDPQQSFIDDLNVIWCNMYFIYNKKKKRVAFLYLLATILNESTNNSTTMRRRNSKIGTLDEEGMKIGEDDSEYDLRYNNDNYEPIYEDVFEEDDINMDNEDNNVIVQGKHGPEEFDYDEDNDFQMTDDELANENQDDEGFV